ncbi:endonuclease/exonuclease/phosphatase family metal-dependent hydrolase [Microvirga flocculans]|uniref:Endonuclease/exonuclease/phosphatase family metal-dependent hydrolase n=1 Tax=Microvirga flocculans TaxID=217168 RepID=A0A7W6IH62_9HYPH|nr:endonuclease/exonuclease/phosphatase family protein [Microvirga flocculans]MBB4041422.1 endonuclease/exonuclease/phosphatase family metal-dependent hydrolase [Microvirga flocculans]
MRPLIDRLVPALEAPEPLILEEARHASLRPSLRREEAHRHFLERIPALHAIEGMPSAHAPPWPGTVRVAAFNAQRLRNRPALRHLMDEVGATITLLSEADCGMARSGNVHTIRELTSGTEEGYLYGVEFVELDHGSEDEARRWGGEHNGCSLHGNALVSGLSLEDAHLIPLEETGFWFRGLDGFQRRIGGRMALAARVAGAPKPLWVVSVHLESKTDPADRQAQMKSLLRALAAIAPDEACIIGGDLNTKALPRAEGERRLLLDAPERYEPLFADLKDAGFEWRFANLALPTQTPGPTDKHRPPFGKLDWIVVRGVTACNPQIVHAVDEQGRPISDHEMIAADIVL